MPKSESDDGTRVAAIVNHVTLSGRVMGYSGNEFTTPVSPCYVYIAISIAEHGTLVLNFPEAIKILMESRPDIYASLYNYLKEGRMAPCYVDNPDGRFELTDLPVSEEWNYVLYATVDPSFYARSSFSILDKHSDSGSGSPGAIPVNLLQGINKLDTLIIACEDKNWKLPGEVRSDPKTEEKEFMPGVRQP